MLTLGPLILRSGSNDAASLRKVREGRDLNTVPVHVYMYLYIHHELEDLFIYKMIMRTPY